MRKVGRSDVSAKFGSNGTRMCLTNQHCLYHSCDTHTRTRTHTLFSLSHSWRVKSSMLIFRPLNAIVAYVTKCVWEISQRKCTYNNVCILVFRNCLQNTDCNLFCFFVVVIVVTQNGQFSSCATTVSSVTHIAFILSQFVGAFFRLL